MQWLVKTDIWVMFCYGHEALDVETLEHLEVRLKKFSHQV